MSSTLSLSRVPGILVSSTTVLLFKYLALGYMNGVGILWVKMWGAIEGLCVATHMHFVPYVYNQLIKVLPGMRGKLCHLDTLHLYVRGGVVDRQVYTTSAGCAVHTSSIGKDLSVFYACPIAFSCVSLMYFTRSVVAGVHPA